MWLGSLAPDSSIAVMYTCFLSVYDLGLGLAIGVRRLGLWKDPHAAVAPNSPGCRLCGGHGADQRCSKPRRPQCGHQKQLDCGEQDEQKAITDPDPVAPSLDLVVHQQDDSPVDARP
jgi:hypothetical protein